MTMAVTMRARVENASRQRLAHFISVRRRRPNSSCLSASVLLGSQFSGGDSGEMSTKMPASQKSGNTASETGQDASRL